MVEIENIRHFNLILSKNCNMNCIYCIQGGQERLIGDGDKCQEMSPAELCDRFPSKKTDYQVVFFGGEPLLNFDYMIEFSKLLKEKNPYVDLSVVTNGSLLTKEKVEQINTYGIRVTISHDGVAYQKTRRMKDILVSNGDVIAAIEKLQFICVLSVENWNLYDNWNYFEQWRLKYNIKRPTVNITLLKDTQNNIPNDLMLYNHKGFENVLDKVFEKLKKAIIDQDYETFEYKCFERTISRIYYEGILGRGVTSCLSKADILNVDTFGNVFRCHNILDCIDGHLNSLDVLDEQVVNDIADRCKWCHINWMCPKCPRVLDEKRKYYCYGQKQIYGRLLNMLNELVREGVTL